MSRLDSPKGPAAPPPGSLLAVLEESALARPTTRLALALAKRMGAAVTFHVAIDFERLEALSAASAAQALADHHRACEKRARPVLDEALALAKAAGVPADTVLTVDEPPLAAVQRVAHARGCALLVVGSHGRGAVARALHGSLVADLVRQSAVPVLVCREDSDLAALAAHAAERSEPQADGG